MKSIYFVTLQNIGQTLTNFGKKIPDRNWIFLLKFVVHTYKEFVILRGRLHRTKFNNQHNDEIS